MWNISAMVCVLLAGLLFLILPDTYMLSMKHVVIALICAPGPAFVVSIFAIGFFENHCLKANDRGEMLFAITLSTTVHFVAPIAIVLSASKNSEVPMAVAVLGCLLFFGGVFVALAMGKHFWSKQSKLM